METPVRVHSGAKPFDSMAKMLLYSVGHDQQHQISPGAVGEVCIAWRAGGVGFTADGPFGWGPIADNIVSAVETHASSHMQEACLLAASHIKPTTWDSVVKPAFTRAGKAMGFLRRVTLTSLEVERANLRQMDWISLSVWTTPTTDKYATGNSVAMAEVTPSLARYVRTRSRIAPMFVKDNDGIAIGLDPENTTLFISILLDAARLSRWAHGSGDENDNFYETIMGIKVHLNYITKY